MRRLNRTLRRGSPAPVSLASRALSAIRRNGGTLLLPGLPRNWLDSAGTIAATVDNPVGLVQDSVGSNHATQPTTASKPLLRRDANGNYAWQFDGSNDFLQTGITTGNEGWVCAGVTFRGAASAIESVAGSGAKAPTSKGVWLARVGAVTENTLWLAAGNGTTRNIAAKTDAVLRNSPKVIEGGWIASTIFVGVDGVSATAVPSGDLTPPNGLLQVGSVGGVSPLMGPMTATVYTPVLPSAADRALIRRFIGSLQGQQL